MKKFSWLIYVFLICACKNEPADKKDKPASGPYFTQVKGIVQTHCTISCHAPSLGFMQGMPVILDTDSDISKRALSIKNAVTGPYSITNKPMPPGGSLSAQEIAVITKWVTLGGKVSD